jgi:hypothetical protein
MAAKLNENTEVALPLRNIISMVAAASLATWAYFGIIERLNQIETNITMMESDFVLSGLVARWAVYLPTVNSSC